MLPRKKLISLRQEFPRIRKEGEVYDSASFGLVVAYGKGPKAAFIVSKKISLKSVVRHEVKRKLSDAVAPQMARLGNNVELVFLAKQKAVTQNRESLETEVQTVLKRARLL